MRDGWRANVHFIRFFWSARSRSLNEMAPRRESASYRKALGRAVQRRRADLRLSQDEVSHEAQADRTYMSGLERGARNPTLDTIIRVARALDTSPGALLGQAEGLLGTRTWASQLGVSDSWAPTSQGRGRRPLGDSSKPTLTSATARSAGACVALHIPSGGGGVRWPEPARLGLAPRFLGSCTRHPESENLVPIEKPSWASCNQGQSLRSCSTTCCAIFHCNKGNPIGATESPPRSTDPLTPRDGILTTSGMAGNQDDAKRPLPSDRSIRRTERRNYGNLPSADHAQEYAAKKPQPPSSVAAGKEVTRRDAQQR